MSKSIIIFIIIIFAYLSTTIAQEWRGEIDEKMKNERGEIIEREKEVSGLNEIIREKERKKISFHEKYNEASLNRRQIDLEIKRNELERDRVKSKIQIMINNPDISDPDKLQLLQNENIILQQNIKKLKDRLSESIIIVDKRKNQLDNIASEIEGLKSNVNELRSEIKEIADSLTEIVEVTQECIITQSISPNECKVSAIENAEKMAIDLGGQSIIKAVTEMVNYQLTRDEVTREINAKIIQKQIDVNFDKGKGDFGKYSVKIIAAVQNIPKTKSIRFTGFNEKEGVERKVEYEEDTRMTYETAENLWKIGKNATIVASVFTGLIGLGALLESVELEDEKTECESSFPIEGRCSSAQTQQEKDQDIVDIQREIDEADKTLGKYAIYTTILIFIAIYLSDNPPNQYDYALDIKPYYKINSGKGIYINYNFRF